MTHQPQALPRLVPADHFLAFTTKIWSRLISGLSNFSWPEDLSWTGALIQFCQTKLTILIFSGLPNDSLTRGRNWVWDGDTSHLQDQRGVSWQDHELILSGALPQGVRHRGGALQRHPVSPPAGGEHWRDVLHWQWGSLWHLLQVRLAKLFLLD